MEGWELFVAGGESGKLGQGATFLRKNEQGIPLSGRAQSAIER
jgi:hypothetical protein